ncbi:MAG: c-type cytochrome [Sulfurimonas sp.]|jgi:cytochrome c553|nr:cytochrome C [Sulfurimonadaceae bacterium]
MKKIAIASLAVLGLSSVLMAGVPASCNGCHGPDGSKNTMVQGGEGIPNTMTKADLKEALHGYKAGTLNKFGKGAMMVSFSKPLTDAQIDEIAEAWGK